MRILLLFYLLASSMVPVNCKPSAYLEKTNGISTLPLDSASHLPIFRGGKRIVPDFFVSAFTERFRMYREGDSKIVRVNGKEWELYNMAEDRTEIFNLGEKNPDLVNILFSNYEDSKAELPE